jgi:hypothetical protein
LNCLVPCDKNPEGIAIGRSTELYFVIDKLLDAYVAYLPWFGLAVGIILLIVGSTTSRSRRLTFIGLGVAGVSALWLLMRISAST